VARAHHAGQAIVGLEDPLVGERRVGADDQDAARDVLAGGVVDDRVVEADRRRDRERAAGAGGQHVRAAHVLDLGAQEVRAGRRQLAGEGAGGVDVEVADDRVGRLDGAVAVVGEDADPGAGDRRRVAEGHGAADVDQRLGLGGAPRGVDVVGVLAEHQVDPLQLPGLGLEHHLVGGRVEDVEQVLGAEDHDRHAGDDEAGAAGAVVEARHQAVGRARALVDDVVDRRGLGQGRQRADAGALEAAAVGPRLGLAAGVVEHAERRRQLLGAGVPHRPVHLQRRRAGL
jgi:hypothetical protein